MGNKITHQGVVDSIEGDRVRVRILQHSACSACKVAGHCNASETKEKLIDVHTVNASLFSVGQTVTVEADASVGLTASFYGYVLPLIWMVGVLVGVRVASGSDGMAALASIASLIPYYLLLYLFRNKVKRQLYFRIK